MAGQLPAGDRLTRLRRVGLGVIALGVLGIAALASLMGGILRSSPTRFVVRPEVSVQGLTVGSVVRLNGVVIGRVARVGLWTDPAGGRMRPEIALALDTSRLPVSLRSPAAYDEGLRVRFIPVNPASGFLEVDLVWAPGSTRLTATADPEELPWQPSEQQVALKQLMPMVRRRAVEDLAPRVDRLVAALASTESRVAEGSGVVAGLARRAAELRGEACRLEQAAGPDAVATAQGRLGEVREALAVAEASLDAMHRDLAGWPGAAGETLRGFSAACRASAGRLRRQVPAEASR